MPSFNRHNGNKIYGFGTRWGNPRTDLVSAKRKLGIRIQKLSAFREKILEYRKEFYLHETPKILGLRKPSTKTRNAFGARHFQPHIAILKSGSGIQTDLT